MNVHVNEKPPMHHEEITEEVENVEEIGQEEEVQTKAMVVLPIDPMLA